MQQGRGIGPQKEDKEGVAEKRRGEKMKATNAEVLAEMLCWELEIQRETMMIVSGAN